MVNPFLSAPFPLLITNCIQGGIAIAEELSLSKKGQSGKNNMGADREKNSGNITEVFLGNLT